MDYEMMLAYIKPELLILIPVLWALGLEFKKSKQVEDWKIPFILLAIALILTISYVLIVSGINPMAAWVGIMQGLVIWAVEGQGYQMYKQSRERKG